MTWNRVRRSFFPANSDLADILGDMVFDFENFNLLICLCIPKSGFPDFQIPRFPSFLTPVVAIAAAATLVELSDPNLTPLPTHAGIKYDEKHS